MSHYSVAVITKDQDVEKVLAPYDENLEVEPYVIQTRDEIIDEVLKEKQDYDNGTHFSPDYFETCYGTVDFNNRDEIYSAYRKKCWDENYDENGNKLSDYNPKSKWDWWALGGRYGMLLKLKEGVEPIDRNVDDVFRKLTDGYADHAQVKDIDFSRNEEKYNKAIRYWEVVVEGSELLPHEKKEDFETFWKKQYFIDQYENKETYAECRADFYTYAILYHGEWIEPGQMGWFACSDSTPESYKAYRKRFKEIIENLDPEDYLTVVDCHI